MFRLFVLTFLIGGFFILAKCEQYLRFANCDCKVNQKYLNLTKCNLKALAREKVTATVEFYMLEDVHNATIHLSVLKRSSSGRFYPFLFDYWANVCEAVKESPKVTFVIKQAKRIMEKFSNAVKCDHQVNIFGYFVNISKEYLF